MEVKVNREIRDYTEGVFFGLSLRQCAFAALACAAAVGVFLALEPALGLEPTSWSCVAAASPLVGAGFARWHGMSAEEAAIAWVRSEVLCPRALLPGHPNLYARLLGKEGRR